MNQAQQDAIAFPDWGLLIFQFNNNPGFYYNKGNGTPDWVKVGAENTNTGFLPFTTAGIHLLTVPQGVSSLEIEALSSGCGGGGGQVYNGSFCGVGGGGGAGGYLTGLIKVNPGDIITITIGVPGTGGTTNTTPTPGNPGTDAGNTTIQVNGSLVLELTGGKGGSGGFSDGTQNSGVGISGRAGGGLSIYFSSFNTPYNAAGGGQGGQGASWGTGAPALQWGICSFINAFTLYGPLDGSTHPLNGQGGRGGNNTSSAGNGVVGYVKFKY